MNITSINTSDSGGGAAKIASSLHSNLLNQGFNSRLIVANKQTNIPSVHQVPQTLWRHLWKKFDNKLLKSHLRGTYTLYKLLKFVKSPHEQISKLMGKENYHHPQTNKIIAQFKVATDIFHCHNLHYDYFDMRILPSLAEDKPVLITLHDEYLYTGLCASTLGCERWRSGCGNCPQLGNYPTYKRDNTHNNWIRKKAIFEDSWLTLVTPSAWLAQRTRESFLSHLPVHVIPNGIDLSVFREGSKTLARERLGLTKNAFIILSIYKAGRSGKYKDREMLKRVIDRLLTNNLNRKITLVILGARSNHDENNDNFRLIKKTFTKTPEKVAEYFQASDLYIHTADAETFGLTVCEAMACGTPVVATNAGGIPELVRDGETGYTVPIGDDQGIVTYILSLMANEECLKRMGWRAAQIARNEYSLERMVDAYIQLYQELILEHNK